MSQSVTSLARQRDLDRVRKAHLTAAKLTADDPTYAPIFERMERELASAEAAMSDDPITRARAALQSATV